MSVNITKLNKITALSKIAFCNLNFQIMKIAKLNPKSSCLKHYLPNQFKLFRWYHENYSKRQNSFPKVLMRIIAAK